MSGCVVLEDDLDDKDVVSGIRNLGNDRDGLSGIRIIGNDNNGVSGVRILIDDIIMF